MLGLPRMVYLIGNYFRIVLKLNRLRVLLIHVLKQTVRSLRVHSGVSRSAAIQLRNLMAYVFHGVIRRHLFGTSAVTNASPDDPRDGSKEAIRGPKSSYQ